MVSCKKRTPFVSVKPAPMRCQAVRFVEASRPKPVLVGAENPSWKFPLVKLCETIAGAAGGTGNAMEYTALSVCTGLCPPLKKI